MAVGAQSVGTPGAAPGEPVVAAVTAAALSAARRILVCGAAGAGKSWVLGQVARRLAPQLSVVQLVGRRSSAAVPYAALPDFLQPGAATATDGVRWIRAAETTAPGPVVFLVDDVQWVDAWSLTVLDRLAESKAGTIVGTARAGSGEAQLSAVFGDAVHIDIPPLDADAARRLLTTLAPGIFDRIPDMTAAVAGACGNPGLLAAMADVVRGASAVSVPPLPVSAVPQLRGLSQQEREVVELLATAGHPVAVEVAADALGAAEVNLLHVARRLDEAQVVSLASGGARIAVPWVEEAVRSTLPQGLREYLHRRLAAALQQRGDTSTDVARHLLAGRATSEAAIPWLLQAADAAMRHTPAQAVEFLTCAADVQRRIGSVTTDVIGRLVQALVVAGRPGEAAGVARSSLHRVTSSEAALPLSVTLAEALWLGDQLADAVAQLDHAEHSATVDADERVTIAAQRSVALILSGEFEVGATQAAAALHAATQLDAHIAVSFALSAQAHLAYYAGDVTGALAAATSALHAAERSGSDEARRRARYDVGMFSIHADQIDGAVELFRSERLLESGSGPTWFEPIYTIGLGIALYTRGQWTTAAEELKHGLDLAARTGILWESAAARSYLAAILAHAGDTVAAMSVLDALPVATRDTPHHSADAVLWARALVCEVEGDLAGALELFRSSYELVEQFNVPVRLRWLAPDLVRTALRVNAHDLAARVFDRLQHVARRAEVTYITAMVEHCRSMITGQTAPAGRAVQLLRTTSRPLELASAAENAGRLFCQKGDVRQGLSLLAEALGLYGQLGAAHDVARVRSSFDSFGMAPGRPRDLSAAELTTLTAAENRVAQLAARGLRNAEIGKQLRISPRTVEVHLTRTFAKLGLRSRAELAAMLPRWPE